MKTRTSLIAGLAAVCLCLTAALTGCSTAEATVPETGASSTGTTTAATSAKTVAPSGSATESSQTPAMGGDGIDLPCGHVDGIFSIHNIDGSLMDLFTQEELNTHYRELFQTTDDFSIPTLFEYYGIPKEMYVGIMETYVRPAHQKSVRPEEYEVALSNCYNYDALFGENPLTNPVFFREGETPPASVTIRPESDTIHTNRYFTIDATLIDHVGEEAFQAFRDQYGGTEDFNILKFVEQFNISKEQFIEITDYHGIAEGYRPLGKPYNPDYVYGTPEMVEDYFTIHAIDSDTLSARYDQIIQDLTALRAQWDTDPSSAS